METSILRTQGQRCKGSRFLLYAGTLLLAAGILPRTSGGATVTYNTAPYWPSISAILTGTGRDNTSTTAQTFVAPVGASVTLNDFTFYAESYYPLNGGVATLHLRPFVYSWSGSLTGNGGGAVGSALYLGPSFLFSPPPRPNGWVPLTAQLGGSGLTLTPGQHYVMGFTLSDPTDYAASQGDIEFQIVPVRNPNYNPPPIPPGVDFGRGGVVWLSNSNNFSALNTTVWDTWGDVGVLAFAAHFTVIPEPSASALAVTGVGFLLGRWRTARRSVTQR